MILPLSDAPNPRGVPVVTYILLGLNVAVYLLVTLPLSHQAADPRDPVLREYLGMLLQLAPRGVSPEALLQGVSAYDLFVFKHGFRPAAPEWLDLLSSMFLHGGLMHLFGNMLFLWIYGDNVEYRLGPIRYLGAYLLTGVAATLFYTLFAIRSPVPLVGASGAISGLLGFYFLWFPRNTVRLFVFLFPFFMNVVEVSARIVLAIYLIIDNLLPFFLSSGAGMGGVAHGAHIGGFVVGLAAARYLDHRELRVKPEEYRPTRVEQGPPRLSDAVRLAMEGGELDRAARVYFSLDTERTRGLLRPAESLRLAGWLAANRHPEAALVLYRRHLRDFPSGPGVAEAHVGAGQIQLESLGQVAPAYQHFLEALGADPDPATAVLARNGLARISELQKYRLPRWGGRAGWVVFLCSAMVAAGGELPAFDFADPAQCAGWHAVNDLAPLASVPMGMQAEITGRDPYLHGPPADYPAGMLLWLNVRLRSIEGGEAQVFFFRDQPAEDRSVRFVVPAGEWFEGRIPMPPLGPGYRLRVDPPGAAGGFWLARIWFEERIQYAEPSWPVPRPVALGEDLLEVESGVLALGHHPALAGAFEVRVGDRRVAIGNPVAQAAYVNGDGVRWMGLGNQPGQLVAVRSVAGGGIQLQASWRDADDGRWDLRQSFVPEAAGSIAVDIEVAVDRDRAVLYLPVLTLLPGVGSQGTNKHQALLAGVEYLENEPSSSEADLVGPAARRLVPDTLKLTMPLMALEHEGRYVGLWWEPQADLCAVHDSPDRQFGSGGHLMGLLYPGSDGVNRDEGSLLPYWPAQLQAHRPFRVRAVIIGGFGSSVVPAVKQYIQTLGLPPVPDTGYSPARYYELAARGWLDSGIRTASRFRHALWPGFEPQPAADAAVWMRWLSEQPGLSEVRPRLHAAVQEAISEVPSASLNGMQIGHNRYPLPALVFGSVLENARQSAAVGRSLLRRFEGDGFVPYRPPLDGEDYGRKHWSREANGLTAGVLLGALEAAVFTGDAELQRDSLRHLRALQRFGGSVPRGAQTWEIPLHTPDILASASLVRVYTLGYELTGEAPFLEEARYWAWTGVPFVYLTPPTRHPVGLYGTIPVLGATGWKAPVWIGLPVQWCGLVFAEALYHLMDHDPQGPWGALADGITAAGLQHTWPTEDAVRQGLLPDFFILRAQRRDGPAINPATLLWPSIRLFHQPPPYGMRVFRGHGIIVHAPGRLSNTLEKADGASFRLSAWSPAPSWLLVNGLKRRPEVWVDGRVIDIVAPHEYEAASGRLVLQISQDGNYELRL
jgi:membrane associated rhomboid family serine protease